MVSDVCFPRVNGVSTSIATYRDSLVAAGHEVSLIAPAYPIPGDEPEGWITRIPSRGEWRDPEDRMMRYRAVLARGSALEGAGFDIVHIHTPFVAHYAGVRLARRLGIPVIESYHTYFEEYLGCYLPFVPRALTRWMARRFSASQADAVDGMIVPSTAMREKLSSYGIATEIRIIPTGLDLGRFRHGDGRRFRATHGIDHHRPMLLYVGRVAHEKNIDFLLEILVEVRKSLPSAMLVVTGEGPAENHLRRLAERLAIADGVKFLGYLDRATDLVDCYAAADVFTFASKTETQGLVLLEAMAMELPVVAPAVMGTCDVLRNGAGALTPAVDDRSDFAAKVVYLLQDRAARIEQGRRARVTASEWSNEACTRRLVGFYAQIIDRRSAKDSPNVHARETVRSHSRTIV
jgi:glycosyltransferase involved in cell wall biosynthesis